MSSPDGPRSPGVAHRPSAEAGRASAELTRLVGVLWPGVEVDVSIAPLACIGIVGQPKSLVEVRRLLQRWAAHTGLAAVQVADVVLASYEALANAVEHAYPSGGGTVDLLAVGTADGRVLITVRDHGRWRPPPRDTGSRGRGLSMIKALAHRAEVQPGPHGTCVQMEWQLSATVSAVTRRRGEAG